MSDMWSIDPRENEEDYIFKWEKSKGMTREEAINVLNEVKEFDDSMYQYSKAYMMALNMAIEALERKRGEWITIKGSNGKDYRKCTNCLHTQEITGLLNYCPVCGADMRGDVHGDIN